MKLDDAVQFNSQMGEPHRAQHPHTAAPVQPGPEINHRRNSDTVSTTQLDHTQLRTLEATNAISQNIAQDIRSVNQTFEQIDSHLGEMRAALERIVKVFPPYPPGSTERVDALRQFSAFRKLIDQIAQPVHSRPADLDIPTIEIDSDEQQIRSAIDKTSSSIKSLNFNRQQFIAGANQFISKIS